MTRQTKTPRQRAEEEVARLHRAHTRLMTRKGALLKQAEDFDPQIREVEAQLAYARANPALPTLPERTTPSTTDTTED